MSLMEAQGLQGVYNILATPFTDDFKIDEASLRRLVESTISMGVDGITVLGVAGEAQKLTTKERERVTSLVIEVTHGRVPVFVGASYDGTEVAIEASKSAVAVGARGLMVAPPTNLQPGPNLTEHYRRLAEAVQVPIVLQDYPAASGVTMTPDDMTELIKAVPQITTIKLEGIPTPQRTAKVLSLLGSGPTVVGGLGGVYFLDELRRGAKGTMTGFAFPEILVQIWQHWAAGDRMKATEVYHRYLPLLVFEGQPGIGLAIRKEILRRRGFITSSAVRQPGPKVDKGILADLSETLDVLGVMSAFGASA